MTYSSLHLLVIDQLLHTNMVHLLKNFNLQQMFDDDPACDFLFSVFIMLLYVM